MNVQELFSLSNWYMRYYTNIESLYNGINSILQNNAAQTVQSPLEDSLNSLKSYLTNMDFGSLSLQQIKILDALGVRNLLGEDGAAILDSTVKTVTYDPATTQKKIQSFIDRLRTASLSLSGYNSAITVLGISPETFDETADRVTIRIGFQNQASIENITDWKESAKDWWEIIRGLAMAAGESPEDTRVVGATKGSLILVLAGTYAVTNLLARISKHIASIARDIISVRTELENLRQKAFFTKVMENEFKAAELKLRAEGLAAIQAELKKELAKGVSGEVTNALDRSVEKLLTHSENGGNVDFVSPPIDEEKTDDTHHDQTGQSSAQLEDVRKTIQEYQQVREAVRLLTNENRSPE
jgi:hypothetical protein